MRCLIDKEPKSADLQSLLTCVKIIPCSSAECERDFSLVNIIISDLRASPGVENIANLMFININGPPLSRCQPEKYVKSWLTHHHSATDTKSRVEKKNNVTCDNRLVMWNILNN